MANEILEHKKFSPEEQQALTEAIELLQDALQKYENQLPAAVNPEEFNDLARAASIYQECLGDDACSRQNLKFDLRDFTGQILARKQDKIMAYEKSRAAPAQPVRKRGQESMAAFQEMIDKNPLPLLRELNKKYAGKPEMIVDEEDKIKCYQAAKMLLAEMKHPVNPIKPGKQDLPTVAFARQAVFELQNEVEGRLAKAA